MTLGRYLTNDNTKELTNENTNGNDYIELTNDNTNGNEDIELTNDNTNGNVVKNLPMIIPMAMRI